MEEDSRRGVVGRGGKGHPRSRLLSGDAHLPFPCTTPGTGLGWTSSGGHLRAVVRVGLAKARPETPAPLLPGCCLRGSARLFSTQDNSSGGDPGHSLRPDTPRSRRFALSASSSRRCVPRLQPWVKETAEKWSFPSSFPKTTRMGFPGEGLSACSAQWFRGPLAFLPCLPLLCSHYKKSQFRVLVWVWKMN